MREAFITSALLAGLLGMSLPALAEDDTAGGTHIPHTKIWLEKVKYKDHFPEDSFWVEMFPEEEALCVTRTEQEESATTNSIRVGDCIETVNGLPIDADLEQFKDRWQRKSRSSSKYDSSIKVIREGEPGEIGTAIFFERERE